MGVAGLFTASDLMTICRAASLAERLTEKHFDLDKDHWKSEPYTILTLKQVNRGLYEPDVFANVIRYKAGQTVRQSLSRNDMVLCYRTQIS